MVGMSSIVYTESSDVYTKYGAYKWGGGLAVLCVQKEAMCIRNKMHTDGGGL